ncbi:MAG TPA: hypothetical protein VFB36_10775 [Nevskiaceae bacterium]|nr:hypothetical protein [Nevskiaceae bacterium]
MPVTRKIPRALALVFALGITGCAIRPIAEPVNTRPFNFQADTLSYANELEWDYQTSFAAPPSRDRDRTYTAHCIVMARTARQFFQFARFDASRPRASDETYRTLIRGVVAHSPTEPLPDGGRIIIPGYKDLRSFSKDKEQILKDEIGTWVGTYLQVGNWRMIFPFTRGHQRKTAEALYTEAKTKRPPIVHLIRFPRITINHAVLIYDAHDDGAQIRYDVYDPNSPGEPTELVFDKKARTFNFAANRYFVGGPLNVYEIFRDAFY